MLRSRLPLLGLLATAALAGCGGSGLGLFGTVPPPVEFVSTIVPGLAEVPAAGTYSGTVTRERVSYVYTPGSGGADGSWTLESSAPLSEAIAAQAIVASDGTVRLKETASAQNLFVGNFEVLEKATIYGTTVANLVGPDRAKGTYPYLLRGNPPRTLELIARANLKPTSQTHLQYDRYSFSLVQD